MTRTSLFNARICLTERKAVGACLAATAQLLEHSIRPRAPSAGVATRQFIRVQRTSIPPQQSAWPPVQRALGPALGPAPPLSAEGAETLTAPAGMNKRASAFQHLAQLSHTKLGGSCNCPAVAGTAATVTSVEIAEHAAVKCPAKRCCVAAMQHRVPGMMACVDCIPPARPPTALRRAAGRAAA